MESEDERKARSDVDKGFQTLFVLCKDVLAAYKLRESVDGVADLPGGLSSEKVDGDLDQYKAFYDRSDWRVQAVYVDSMLEVYEKHRDSLRRGYLCNTWLLNDSVKLYYGTSLTEAKGKVLHLDAMFTMIESLMRTDTSFRQQATVFKVKFGYQLYGLLIACLRHSEVIDHEENIRGVTPEIKIKDDIKVLEEIQKPILDDLPKPTREVSQMRSPMDMLSSVFPGGMQDALESFKTSLPSFTKNVTETVSKMTGLQITDKDKETMDLAMSNVGNLLSDPSNIGKLLSNFNSGPDGITKLVEQIFAKPGGSAPGSAPGPGPAPEGPAQD
jgi:hypothetical protein